VDDKTDLIVLFDVEVLSMSMPRAMSVSTGPAHNLMSLANGRRDRRGGACPLPNQTAQQVKTVDATCSIR
jgi:hypothetical protein